MAVLVVSLLLAVFTGFIFAYVVVDEGGSTPAALLAGLSITLLVACMYFMLPLARASLVFQYALLPAVLLIKLVVSRTAQRGRRGRFLRTYSHVSGIRYVHLSQSCLTVVVEDEQSKRMLPHEFEGVPIKVDVNLLPDDDL